MSDNKNDEIRALSLTEIQAVAGGANILTQAYQAFMTLAKSFVDSKGEVQKALSRFS